MWMETSAGVPRSSSASATIFQAVLRLSVGTRGSLEVRTDGCGRGRVRRHRDEVVQFQGLVDRRRARESRPLAARLYTGRG